MTDLTPMEGISDYWVEFDGLDTVKGSGGAYVRFRMVRVKGQTDERQATFSFWVEPENDGVDGLIGRGFDQLIDAMRQMIFQADTMRSAYKKSKTGGSR
jgi:hypothetical protein